MIDPLDILALLEEKPYTETELIALFETSRPILRFALKALKRDGRVKTLADGRVALSSFAVPPAPLRATRPARMLPDVGDEPDDDMDESVDTLAAREMDAADVDLEAALVEPLPQRVNGQRRLSPRATNPAGAPLRQTRSKPAIATDGGPSWWVGLSRDQLAAGIADRAEGMRGTKEKMRVPLRILQ